MDKKEWYIKRYIGQLLRDAGYSPVAVSVGAEEAIMHWKLYGMRDIEYFSCVHAEKMERLTYRNGYRLNGDSVTIKDVHKIFRRRLKIVLSQHHRAAQQAAAEGRQCTQTEDMFG